MGFGGGLRRGRAHDGGRTGRFRLAWIRPAVYALVLGAAGSIAAPTAARGDSDVVQVPVRFSVENLNRSQLPCPTDGRRYSVAGRLVAPRALLRPRSPAVTLYLHGLGYGAFYWHFTALPGYDYASRQAQRGHASVIIDRLGYDASDHPAGTETCIGAHADVAHQIVGALRSGSYDMQGPPDPPAFQRVALAGHSLGTQIAQVASYSFGGIDALVGTAYANQGSTDRALRESAASGAVCARGGESADGGKPGGYAYFGQQPEDFRASMFHSADSAAIEAATSLRNRDPCGDFSSLLPAILLDRAGLASVEVPVLIVCGAKDALFTVEGCTQQQDLFRSSDDLATVVLPQTGHALTLEQSRDSFATAVSGWLRDRGF